MGGFKERNEAKITVPCEGERKEFRRKKPSDGPWLTSSPETEGKTGGPREHWKASRKKNRTGNRHRWVGAECTKA